MRKAAHLILPILALLCSCEDSANDYRYPSVSTDYACLITDTHGQPQQLRLDNGSAYPIVLSDDYREGHSQLPIYTADTTYRVISVYEFGADSIAQVYSIGQTFSIVPTPLRKGMTLHQAPSYLQSCWVSGGYLNMVIELKGLNVKHSVGFVDTTPHDMEGKEFTFYHDANGDVESYRQKLYGSIPLAPFAKELQRGHTLRFVINEYDKGVTRYEFVL